MHYSRLIIHVVPLDYLVISETKLDDSLPNAQLTRNIYKIRTWGYREKDGGLIELVRKGIICKRLKKYDLLNIEVICSKVKISNKISVIFSIYRPPGYSNLLASLKNLESI